MLHSARRAVHQDARAARLGRSSGRRCVRAARARVVPADVRRVVRRRRRSTSCSGCSSPGCWCAIDFPGRRLRRRAGRSAVRAADRGRRHRADRRSTRRTAGSAATSSRSASRSRSRRSASSIALTFIGLPFVVRTVQPVLEDLEPRSRRPRRASARAAGRRSAASSCPRSLPALLTGFALAFARAHRRVRLGGLHLRQHADSRPRSRRCSS